MLNFKDIKVDTIVKLKSREELLTEVKATDNLLAFAGQWVTITGVDTSDENLTIYSFGIDKPGLVDADIAEILFIKEETS